MKLSIEGAREAYVVVEAFHGVLNGAALVPEHCYRRNKVSYLLVCYVNNIIGLFLSKNYEVIPVFIGRAAQHMAENPASPGSVAYYKVVTMYLAHMAFVVGSFTDLPHEELEAHVPADLLSLGKQEAPFPGLVGGV